MAPQCGVAHTLCGLLHLPFLDIPDHLDIQPHHIKHAQSQERIHNPKLWRGHAITLGVLFFGSVPMRFTTLLDPSQHQYLPHNLSTLL